LEELDKGEGRGKTLHAEYSAPGGTNYREVLLKMPEGYGTPSFYSSHWPNDANVLSHFRVTDRTAAALPRHPSYPNDRNILLIEEIQSDWHQRGKAEGYGGIGRSLSREGEERSSFARVPDAPLKKTWHEMTFRRALRMAAEEGKDSVAWVPGMAQAMRYFSTDSPDYPAALHGMEEFYDEIIPNYANKFGKKFGAKVESNHIDFPKGGWPGKVWSFPITPEMREHLLREGVSTFAQGGFIDKPLYDRSL